MDQNSSFSSEDWKQLLYTLDRVLPERVTQYDISMICSYIIYRYGLHYEAAEAVYSHCLHFMRHSSKGFLDLTPPVSDRDIN